MPIDRSMWKWNTVTFDDAPQWPCPTCNMPSLVVVKDSYQTIMDRATYCIPDHEFDPESVTGRFVCLLCCTRCHESCAVSGNFTNSRDPFDGSEIQHGTPRMVTPSPPLIAIPAACPKAVGAEVTGAFSLYWIDLAACLNRIRNALELVLDDLKVPRFTLDKAKKKKNRLSPHHRIEKLEKQRPRLKLICERMMAVKHLGNAGSHPGGSVSADDVFDGFDILEKVLEDMYSKQSGELARAVKQINQRRGPRKPKKTPWGE
jgi:hypothetical protein